MKAISLFVLTALALLGVFLFGGCSQYRISGSLGYIGHYGDYSVTSDGKNIVYDVKLKDPRGYAK